VGDDPGLGNGTVLEVNPKEMLDSTFILPFSLEDFNAMESPRINFRVRDNKNLWSLVGKLDIDTCTVYKATADFGMTRYANSISFENLSEKSAGGYHWDFDDGTTSTLSNPVHEFNIGEYDVEFIAGINCRTDTIVKHVSIEGIETFEPKSAGNGGDFTMRIFGGGLNTDAEVKLTGPATIFPVEQRSPDTSELNAFFDLHTAATGVYDVEIKLSSGSTYTFPGGFTVEEKDDFYLETSIEGPSRARVNRSLDYSVVVSNPTNVKLRGVNVQIYIPNGMITDLDDHKASIIERTKEVFDTEGLLPENTVELLMDEMYAIPINSILDEPYEATMYNIWVPFIEPKSNFRIPLKVKFPSQQFNDIRVSHLNYPDFGSPATGWNLDAIHDGGMAMAAVLELIPNPAAKAVGKFADEFDIGTQIAFQKIDDWWFDRNTVTDEFLQEKAIQYGVAKATGKLTQFKKFEALEGVAETTVKNAGKTMKEMFKEVVEGGVRRTGANGLTETQMRTIISDLSGLGPEQIAKAYFSFVGAGGKGLVDKSISDYLAGLLPGDTQMNPSINRLRVQSLNSYDPNEIVGPSGFGESQYIKNEGLANYQVHFENLETATAAAQTVSIVDSLDVSKFDLSTFQFNSLNISGKHYNVEPNRKEFFTDVDLTAERGINLRVNMKLDTVTGVITWKFLSLDPETGELTADPDAGFLPPNNDNGDGQAYVSYSVKLKDLMNDTEIKNIASIVFDENEPIITNEWSNKIDLGNPTAQILEIEELGDNVAQISLMADDAESGIASYLFFYRQRDGEWSMGEGLGNYEEMLFTYDPEKEYEFYVTSRDNVGNLSPPSGIVSFSPSSLSLEQIKPKTGLSIYPNPAKNWFSANASSTVTRITIYDYLGKKVMSLSELQNVDISSLPVGTYLVEIADEMGNIDIKKLIKN
tara:strand:- start:917 stop:3694 length:2778 start_codon:yes stop_codon:yes gene_type:complete